MYTIYEINNNKKYMLKIRFLIDVVAPDHKKKSSENFCET